jgi:chromosome segregation ATPase
MTRKFESLASKVCDEVATASAAGDLRAARQAVEFALETAHSAGVTKLLNENKLAWSQRDHACAEVAMLRRELNDQYKHGMFLGSQFDSLRAERKAWAVERDGLQAQLRRLQTGDIIESDVLTECELRLQAELSAAQDEIAATAARLAEVEQVRDAARDDAERLKRAIGAIDGILDRMGATEPAETVEAVAKLFADARALRANRDALRRDLQAVGEALGGDVLYSGDVPASVRLLRERLSSEGVQRLINENARLKREIDDARDRLAQVTQIACLAPVSRKSGGDMDA